jgi:hypothetical protein
MSASLSDILTAQKNGVVAINNLALYTQVIANYTTVLAGTDQLAPPTAGTTSYVTIYTAPSGVIGRISEIDICNSNSGATSFSINFVPAGGTAGTTNALFYNAPINGNTTVQWTGGLALNAGDTIQVKAAISGITFNVSGGIV